jgi:hypothetical protein
MRYYMIASHIHSGGALSRLSDEECEELRHVLPPHVRARFPPRPPPLAAFMLDELDEGRRDQLLVPLEVNGP